MTDVSETTTLDESLKCVSWTEWTAIETIMGERMTPTGLLRVHSSCPGVTIYILEREWMTSDGGKIWAPVSV